jgi:transposase
MSQITLPLNIKSLEILSQRIDAAGNIVLTVRSTHDHSTCHKCGKPATKLNGHAPVRRIQHLPLFDQPVYLEIVPVRYRCEHCDDGTTTTEQYDWVDRNATITKGLEDSLMRSLINSTVQDVSIKSGVGYKVIQSTLDRLVEAEVDWNSFTSLGTLGIDEIALRKGHDSYLTIVSVRQEDEKLRVVAVIDGRDKATVKSFLESIPSALRETVKTVCTDMYDGYVYAAMEVFGSRAVVVDRYHVAKLYRKPLDTLRVKEMARLKEELDEAEYAKLEGMMWILRKQHECLSAKDKSALELLYHYSPLLKKAHRYALKLTCIFNTHGNRKSGLAKFVRWITAVEKSGLSCFRMFIATLKKYMPFIANYFKDRKSSGFVEGLNNKIKVIKRRCYGLSKIKTIFQRLFLDLQGFEIYA